MECHNKKKEIATLTGHTDDVKSVSSVRMEKQSQVQVRMARCVRGMSLRI